MLAHLNANTPGINWLKVNPKYLLKQLLIYGVFIGVELLRDKPDECLILECVEQVTKTHHSTLLRFPLGSIF